MWFALLLVDFFLFCVAHRDKSPLFWWTFAVGVVLSGGGSYAIWMKDAFAWGIWIMGVGALVMIAAYVLEWRVWGSRTDTLRF